MFLYNALIGRNHTESLMARFCAESNKQKLRAELEKQADIIGENVSFDDLFSRHCAYLAGVLNDGDVLYNGDPLRKLNADFINYVNQLHHVEDRAEHYQINDGAGMTTRFYTNGPRSAPAAKAGCSTEYTRAVTTTSSSADAMLADWYRTASRKVSLREDHMGDRGDHTWVAPGSKQHAEGFINSGIGGIIPSIDVYDYSNFNNNRADSYMDNPKLLAMNSDRLWEGEPGFGRDTDESNRRLYERQIYRKNERGEENGFYVGRAALHNRHVDKEALSSYEHEYMTHKHDMSVLNRKVDSKRARVCKK